MIDACGERRVEGGGLVDGCVGQAWRVTFSVRRPLLGDGKRRLGYRRLEARPQRSGGGEREA